MIDITPLARRQKLGLAVLDYHGGQYTATYALGSSLFAGKPVSQQTIDRGVAELRSLWGAVEFANDSTLARIIRQCEGLHAEE